MFYATRDEDGGRIMEGAEIHAFATEAEMRGFLLAPYQPEGIDGVEVGPGSYGGCWFKSVVEPEEVMVGPFSLDEVRVLRPGEHPGGNFHWVTPLVDVHVLLDVDG